jgi:hypothetical protein
LEGGSDQKSALIPRSGSKTAPSGHSPANRNFVDKKLAKLQREKPDLEELLEETGKIRYEQVKGFSETSGASVP